ncbi:MAG: hypothetical protein L0H43_04415 [Brevibacterium aurantiacum]|nr:hypothetical protein [Brevibacterium aurantiacum]
MSVVRSLLNADTGADRSAPSVLWVAASMQSPFALPVGSRLVSLGTAETNAAGSAELSRSESDFETVRM